METVFSVGSAQRLYKEDPRPAEVIELRFEKPACQDVSSKAEQLRDGTELGIRGTERGQLSSQSGCEEKTLCVLRLQWETGIIASINIRY
jgi:hypothetical protein